MTFRGQKSRSNHKNFEVEYLENGTRQRDGVHRSQMGSHKLCFISQFKCNSLHDSFEIPAMKYYNLIFAVLICDVLLLQLFINNPVFIIILNNGGQKIFISYFCAFHCLILIFKLLLFQFNLNCFFFHRIYYSKTL